MSGDDDEPVDVEGVLSRFRHGVSEQVAEDDLATHVDLAIAYIEMGLYPDAQQELELVLKLAPKHPAARAALEMLRRRLEFPRVEPSKKPDPPS